MKIKSTRQISPFKLRFLSSLIITFIVVMLQLYVTDKILKIYLNNAEEKYFESCNQILEGYSSAIYFYIGGYETSLEALYNRKIFKTKDPKAIQDWLIQETPFIHSDFTLSFYVDLESNTEYFSNGLTEKFDAKDYISSKNFSFGDEYYVSDIVYSQYVKEPSFVIEIPFYDDDNVLKGILCGPIKLSKLHTITDTITLGKENGIEVHLMDRMGRFIITPNKKYFTKTFFPEKEKYKKFGGSEMVAKAYSGNIETEGLNGEDINLFFKKIPVCGWTIAISFPQSALKKVYSQQVTTKIFVLSISIISLLLLLFLERGILGYFYRNQYIASFYDPLTNLMTRNRFELEATRWMKRNKKAKFMLIESDIRGFKFINQNYGEEEADKIISFYSKLLSKITNDYKGITARGYADHFYTFMKVHNVQRAMTVFKAKMDEINEEIKHFEIPFFPKYGITFVRLENRENTTIKELIGQVSFAKNSIKDTAISSYAIYNSRILEKANEMHFIEANMESALINNEFFVMYQPKIDLTTDKIVGAEALVRWKTTDGKIIYPDNFIPLFESNGFIKKLDFYVYEKVFMFLEEQIQKGNPIVPVSLNMSRNHDKPEKFMMEFSRIFKRFHIPASFIQIEILERSVMNNNTLKEITERLHREGFSVAMDDFGSGESSLNMLTKIPVDVLKFDREFLLSSTNEKGQLDAKSAKFIRGLIDLSKQLEKQTIFEGVETKEQRDFLKEASCDQVQGYFYSKPLTEEDYLDFMHSHL
ncbi:MAG: EAL domain-containing protein [Treponema sp.]|nr:EAL domain-containing protein [Treponema sp.]